MRPPGGVPGAKIFPVKCAGGWATFAGMVDSLLGAGGGGNKGRAGRWRLVRTVLLGTLAVAFALFWLARSYGVDPAELVGYLKASMAFVLFFVLTGVLGGMLVLAVRYLGRR